MRLREMIELIEDRTKRGTQTIPIPIDWKPSKPSEIGGKLANKDTASTRAVTRKIPVIKASEIAAAWTADLKNQRK